MTKDEYLQKLKDPRWQRKRLQIFERDDWTCRRCKANHRELQVHHKKYASGRDPWDVPDHYLETVCRDCHEDEHDIGDSATVRCLPAGLHEFLEGGRLRHLLTPEECAEADARQAWILDAEQERREIMARAKAMGIC